MKRNHGKVTFKEYKMGQLKLPMDLGVMIPEKLDVGRFVDHLNEARS